MFDTKNEAELITIGQRIGQQLQKNDLIILTGELGSGKTTLTKGIAKGLEISQMIKSPTYTIVREYEGRLPLYHLDVYRIGGDSESIDLDDFVYGDGVTVIEWGELIKDDLPNDYLEITISKTTDGRQLVLSANGPIAAQRLEAILNAKS
ncbi:tRNA (adenosine(37)-N6)-threonylcarbamoyltransferase complex ATPase subunit type 1 TsaE [Streptococcus zalophi]|uniref:tRNA threonylcarbamoyladenosine biosynthesis protein TsaE n=1 Tax=Streptococcus zalophi TaxID=640031 RepID=A0A934P919_9STRE|nr:tRNA (adenosine(37)-N6)-threonylcarbamoyltransferase complex ATPase subunit type 1 TsaE [Streptococcus zalophi]MBJ8349258.1 tRNA (adenosine(37)-N6)-threonylcarbamoyltransferase complex ATPase subunit type 1 TsaE [Streptococcus zalophi]MCR8967120.1 tRNA (adenosine(37)-N6)-threonylcarbamoyltransferase complex ATPase subunit type 1 TsaE [Streptococcus zalophi]